MHILIIPGEELNENNQYSSVFEINQADALAGQNIKTGFISINLKGSLFTAIKNLLRFKKGSIKYFIDLQRLRKAQKQKIGNYNLVEVSGCYYWPSAFNKKNAEDVQAGLLAFRHYVKNFGKPDLIHGHSRFLTGALIANEIYKKYRIPFLVTEHSSAYARNLVSESQFQQLAEILNNAKKWVVVSPQLGWLIEKQISGLNKSFICIPNVLDKEFEELVPLGAKDDKFIFINIASLDDNKAQHLIIGAFAEVFGNDERFALLLGGVGPNREYLGDLAKQLNIEQEVCFLGHLKRKEVKKYLAKSSVFVLSSHYETFGVVLIEALSCGLPIIATESGGPENIVNNKNGYLVPVNDVAALADAMKKIYNNYTSFNPESIKEDCINRFGSEQFVARMYQVYQEVLQDSGINKNFG